MASVDTHRPLRRRSNRSVAPAHRLAVPALAEVVPEAAVAAVVVVVNAR